MKTKHEKTAKTTVGLRIGKLMECGVFAAECVWRDNAADMMCTEGHLARSKVENCKDHPAKYARAYRAWRGVERKPHPADAMTNDELFDAAEKAYDRAVRGLERYRYRFNPRFHGGFGIWNAARLKDPKAAARLLERHGGLSDAEKEEVKALAKGKSTGRVYPFSEKELPAEGR